MTHSAPSEARDINVKIIQAISAKNAGVEIVSPAAALRAINEAGLANKWADFIEDYYTSGIANKAILVEISKALNVDAIMQGQLVHVFQQDVNGWDTTGTTRITVSFSIIEVSTAKPVWEASSDGVKINAAGMVAPPVADAIGLAIEKIAANLPLL